MAASCKTCGKSEKVKRCARCRCVFYCNQECQGKDFKEHKDACKFAAGEMKKFQDIGLPIEKILGNIKKYPKTEAEIKERIMDPANVFNKILMPKYEEIDQHLKKNPMDCCVTLRFDSAEALLRCLKDETRQENRIVVNYCTYEEMKERAKKITRLDDNSDNKEDDNNNQEIDKQKGPPTQNGSKKIGDYEAMKMAPNDDELIIFVSTYLAVDLFVEKEPAKQIIWSASKFRLKKKTEDVG